MFRQQRQIDNQSTKSWFLIVDAASTTASFGEKLANIINFLQIQTGVAILPSAHDHVTIGLDPPPSPVLAWYAFQNDILLTCTTNWCFLHQPNRGARGEIHRTVETVFKTALLSASPIIVGKVPKLPNPTSAVEVDDFCELIVAYFSPEVKLQTLKKNRTTDLLSLQTKQV